MGNCTVLSLLTFVAAFALVPACGHEEPVKAPEPVSTTPRAHTGPKLNMTSELGSIDDRAVQKTFERITPAFDSCRKTAQKRLSFVAGDVAFFIRVGTDGKVKYSYFEQSTLGDYDAERCLLDVVDGTEWPVPEGGEAEVRYKGYGFDLDQNVRGPFDWNADKVAASLGKHKDELDKCIEGTSDAKFSVTAYVEPAGKDGKVQAAGVAVSNKEGAAKIKCVLDAVKGIKMPSPGSYASKVTFAL